MTAPAIMLALVSAFAYAAAAALQEHAVSRASGDGTPPARLILHLVRRPQWLAGVASTLLGATLHVFALKLGPLAIVQPIGVTGLLFALPLGALLHARRPLARELLSAAGIATGLAVLLASVRASAGHPTLTEPATAGLVSVTAVGVGALVLLARFANGTVRAALLSVGAGIAFGVTSALVRVVAHATGVVGAERAVPGWTTLALLASAVAGLVLAQAAYQSGRLAAVLPVLTVVDPIVAIAVGAVLLGEPVHATAVGLGWAIVAAVVITASTAYLAAAQPAAVSGGRPAGEGGARRTAPARARGGDR